MLWNIGSAIGILVSPPAILLLLITLGLLHLNKRWGLRLAACSLAALWALSTPVVAYPLMDAISAAPPAELPDLSTRHAIIVVLPAGKVRAREYPGGETASPLTVQRARYGVWLANRSGLQIAIPGGKHWGVYSEAEIARNFIQNELHYPVAIVEHTSLDTRQSALNLVRPLRAMNIDTVVLVTDARHIPRASDAFAAVGFNVLPAPMALSAGQSSLVPFSFLPQAEALAVSADVAHELFGRAWYALRSRASLFYGR
jgi:uncharacterized SAM-binding protein YcdF (DUF218 family)